MKFKNILRMLMVTMLSATMIGCSNDKKDVVVNNDEDVVVATSVAVAEILDALASINAEGRPIWKPMHMQPIYRMHGFVTRTGNGRAMTNAYLDRNVFDVGMDLFHRGLCLPSDNKMTEEQQDNIISVIRGCFK